MSSTFQDQLARLCFREETLKEARELLNIARTKTGPGSGHHLGRNAVGLPAICALLASERLVNNDVVPKVAQETSCLHPKAFNAALSTVRSALATYLQRKQERVVSYRAFCHDYRLDNDALYWMEEVEKELRKSGVLEDIDDDVDDETVKCIVFYWTCIALNVRSVKRNTIMSDYGVNRRNFQTLEKALDTTCQDVRQSIDNFLSETRTARSARSTPAKPSAKTPSPIKTPTRTSNRNLVMDGSPLKRKTPFPPVSPIPPAKRPRVASPTKLNRLPVTTNFPSKGAAATTSAASSPTKIYGATRPFLGLSTKTAMLPDVLPESPAKRMSLVPITPVKGASARVDSPAVVEAKTPSPRKSLRRRPTVAVPSTPTPKRGRGRPNHLSLPPLVDADVEMDDPQVSDAESSSDEDSRPPPCRHRLPAFPDRSFYHYRDPRVLREWELCGKNMNAMIEKYGDPLGEAAG